MALIFLLFSSVAFAQKENQRYEVGRRLISFEKEFEGLKDPQVLKVICERLKPITFYFFSGQLDQCAKALDLARWNCKNKGELESGQSVADSLSITPEKRIYSPNDKTINCLISQVYSVKAKSSLKGKIFFCLPTGEKVCDLITVEVESLPVTVSLKIKDVKEGEYHLAMELFSQDKPVALHKVHISLINDASKFVQEMSAAALKQDSEPWKASKQYLAMLLNDLLAGKKFEGDIPVKRITDSKLFLEKGLDAVDQVKGGEYLIAMPGKLGPVPARVFIPPEAKVMRVPLVVALHGAGATENMFFEAYGNGKIKKLCADKGWMLIAPRNGISADNLQLLIKELPIDPNQVIIIGHSMGAAQALSFALNHTKEIKALGLMGGAGSIGKNQTLGTLPVFVGVGAEDFARTSVARFAQDAKKQKDNNLLFKEYEAIEHSSICQVCLPEMFDFFALALKK